MSKLLSVALILGLLFMALPSQVWSQSSDEVDPEIVAWLQENAIPLATTEPSENHDDLAFLSEMIGGARLVGLGEATHGSREFFTMKHRLVQYLVEEMGFTTFAIEANFPEAARINDYLHTGEGDPAELLAGMYYWMWNTQEVLDMILWMRSYNEGVDETEQISFYGFDMQYPGAAPENVIGYLEQFDVEGADLATENYACISRIGRLSIESPDADCVEDAQAVYDYLVNHRQSLIELSSPPEYAMLLQNAQVVMDAFELDLHRGASRDERMADYVHWLMDFQGAESKMVLWAHNGHISELMRHQSMGAYLNDVYEIDVYSIGFSFYEGQTNAWGRDQTTWEITPVTVHQMPPPVMDSWGYIFHGADVPLFYLDLQDRNEIEWLNTYRRFRSVGGIYIENNYSWFKLTEIFDGIIFIDTVTSTIRLDDRP